MDDFSDFANMLGGGDSAFWQEPDFLLSSLVSLMANKLDSEIGITLMIKGMMLTGTLVGEREYLNAINTMFKSIAKNAIAKPSKDELRLIDEAFIFNELTEDVYDDEDEEALDEADEEEGDEDDLEPDAPVEIRHLHIKDPMFIYSNSSISFSESPLPIMRIRLTQVDGWMMGRMTVVPMDDDDDDDLPMPFTGIRH